MELKEQYTVQEVVEIFSKLPASDQEKFKQIILLDIKSIEKLINDDFAKYNATFRALA